MARVAWQRLKPILIQGVGYAFLVLGVLGMFLPFLQGFLFLAIGMVILARHATWAARLLERFRARYPRAGEMIDNAEARAAGWWRRLASLGRR
jgi:uncharacterized membrane protein YbaN (DUF454 family)